ncbi:uncharacterized protein [Mytilus edulis]|uniref:uncharacterized protein n=1 Tax=Mytilus edulis TaxID=6550 RepID=UPI0039EE0C0E
MIVHKHRITVIGVGMVCLICFVRAHADLANISLTKDVGICTKTTWELKAMPVYYNETGILRKGDGQQRIGTHEVEKSGSVFVAVNVSICCPGFHELNKGKCDKCPELTYGLNCSKECRCLSSEKCNQTTGECKRCDENPAVTKCYKETIKGTTQTRTEPSSTLTIVSHTTLFHRQKMKTISSTNAQVDVSVFPTAEERNQDPRQGFQHGDASTPLIAVSVVIPILVIIIIIALLVKRYHGGYNFKKRGTTESVHKLMSESSHTTKLMNESHELTQVNISEEILRGDSYKDVEGNRVYISMYNAMNVDIRHADSDMERKSKDLQYISMHLQYLTKSTRQSIPNDNETVASK